MPIKSGGACKNKGLNACRLRSFERIDGSVHIDPLEFSIALQPHMGRVKGGRVENCVSALKGAIERLYIREIADDMR